MIEIKRKQHYGISSIFEDEKTSILEGVIIASFFPEGKEMTIKEIQERVDYSYERINFGLKSLTKKKIVFEKNIGKTIVYSINLYNLYSQTGFDSYTLERKIEFIKRYKIIYNALKKIIESPSVFGVILFGSYSKGNETKKSDIDIICISNNKKEVEKTIQNIKYKTNINLSTIILPLHEFPNVKKDNPELWHDLKIYGLVLKGEDNFYFWLYKNEK